MQSKRYKEIKYAAPRFVINAVSGRRCRRCSHHCCRCSARAPVYVLWLTLSRKCESQFKRSLPLHKWWFCLSGRFLKPFKLHKCIDVAHAIDVWRPKTLNENIRIKMIVSWTLYSNFAVSNIHAREHSTAHTISKPTLLLNYSWNHNWEKSALEIETHIHKRLNEWIEKRAEKNYNLK